MSVFAELVVNLPASRFIKYDFLFLCLHHAFLENIYLIACTYKVRIYSNTLVLTYVQDQNII